MSDLFAGYEQEFIKYLSSTERKLDSISIQTNLKQQLAFNEIKQDLSEVERNLKYMETETGSLSQQIRPKYQEKVVKHKRSFNEIKRKVARQEEEYVEEKNKQMLLGAKLDEEQGAKEKFIRDGQELSDATYKLKDSTKIMRETEGINDGIQIELVAHTDRLNKNREKLLTVNEDLTESQQILTKMAAIIRRNKLVLSVVLGAVVLAIIIIVSFVIIKKNKASAQTGQTGN